ncbi:putative ribonuclease H protein [Sesbania bispinosa]|nr:putative ribonuclease H protein [Sesbania bispinosa]
MDPETDSLEAIHLINRGTPSARAQFGDVLLEIVELLHRGWDITVSPILREANVIVDFLVKLGGRSIVGLQVLEHPPLDLVQLLETDSFI